MQVFLWLEKKEKSLKTVMVSGIGFADKSHYVGCEMV